MNSTFEYTSTLEYRLKAAQHIIDLFKSGEKYVQMDSSYKRMRKYYEALIKKLEADLARAHCDNRHIIKIWTEANEDLQKEHAKEMAKMQKKYEQMEKRALKAEAALEEQEAKNRELIRQKYIIETELEEQKGINLKLTAQLNRDYTNSSLTTADKRNNKKKIPNNREKTGKKPGAQKGHEHHGRKNQVPTEPVKTILPSEDILNNPDFKPTKQVIVKQRIGLKVILVVEEFRAVVYRNSKTGERVHGEFPKGVIDDVNYDPSIKAFLYLLNNDCNVSIDKSRKFLSDLTNNELNISKGMINKLTREFAEKSKDEQNEIIRRIVASPITHADSCTGKVSGKNTAIFVCVTPEGDLMLFSREHKGHEGIKGTPIEIFGGTLIHDHELTYYSYGTLHQECLVHVLRYLVGSMENEPKREWNKEMHSLIRRMMHERKNLPEGENFTEEKIKEFETEYDEILKKARISYEYEPASEYYREGYNLFLRMEKYKDSHLLFLRDRNIPYENNAAERGGRQCKMKTRQALTFRSFESLDAFCQGKSVLLMTRNTGENIYNTVHEIFSR